MSSLTTAERENIKRHLGYLSLSLVNSISLGIPSASQPLFILESAMNDILPESEANVRRHAAELDCIEDQLSTARGRLAVSRVDEISFRGPEEMWALEDEYSRWAAKLADLLGVVINPFSLQHQRLSGQTIVVENL